MPRVSNGNVKASAYRVARLLGKTFGVCRWRAHGEEVIQRVREENPAAYFKSILSLVQKDVSV